MANLTMLAAFQTPQVVRGGHRGEEEEDCGTGKQWLRRLCVGDRSELEGRNSQAGVKEEGDLKQHQSQ
jgi:hypothetical protein